MRFEHWERRLASVIEGAARFPFAWGVRDCTLFAADCVWALTQRDPAAQWRGQYRDEAGAVRLIAAAGGLDRLTEEGLRSIGVEPSRIAPAFGQRGDPCLFDSPLGPALAIVEGVKLVAQAPDGLIRVPVSSARICWAIR